LSAASFAAKLRVVPQQRPLAGREQSREQRVAVTLQGRRDARQLHEVRAESEGHSVAFPQVSVGL
jgi:hypothetical protein